MAFVVGLRISRFGSMNDCSEDADEVIFAEGGTILPGATRIRIWCLPLRETNSITSTLKSG
jgi:hypothetical protein